MALLERLQILVDANADGAIREFQKVGASAERDLGKAENKLDKLGGQLTQFGTAAVAGGAVAAVGLGRLATAASDYGEALNKATVIVGKDGVKRLEQFAESASDTAGISKTAALDAAAGFAALGKQAGLTGQPLAGFSTQLVQLAGDLASFNNTTVDDALQALKSGLQGETEPLKRFNIFLSDAALKQEYLAVTGEKVSGTLTAQQRIVAAQSLIFKQASDAQGDFGRTSDSLANRQRQLQADFENLKTEIGTGLVPVFETAAGAASTAVGVFQGLPDSVKSVGGTIAGFGTAAAIVGGGVSVAAGQFIKFRDVITTVGEDGSRSLNKLGRAAQVAGFALATLAIADITFGFINEGTNALGEYEDALNKVRIAAKAGDNTLKSFGESVAAEQNTLRLQNLWQEFGAEVSIVGTGIKADVEQVQRAFDGLRTSDPQFAKKVLDDLEAANSGLDRNSRQYQINKEFIDRNRESLDLAGKAAAEAGGEAGKAAGGQQQLADAMAGTGDAAAEAVDPTKALADAVKAAGNNAEVARAGLEAAAAGAKAYTQSIEDSTFQDDLVDGAIKAGDAYKDLNEKLGALPKTLDLAQVALGNTTEDQNKALQALLSYGDGVQGFLARLIESGQTDAARFFAGVVRQTLDAKGVTEEYQRILGLTPDQIDTAITVSGEAEALQKINLYAQLLGEKIPEDISQQVLAFVDEGKLREASFVLSLWRQGEQNAANGQPVNQPVGVTPTGDVGKILQENIAAADANPAKQGIQLDPEPLQGIIGVLQAEAAGSPLQLPVEFSQLQPGTLGDILFGAAGPPPVEQKVGISGTPIQGFLDANKAAAAGNPAEQPARIIGEPITPWLQGNKDEATANPATQTVQGDTAPALQKVAEAKAQIDAVIAQMQVLANTDPARQQIGSVVDSANKSSVKIPVTFTFPQGTIGSLFGLGQRQAQPNLGGVGLLPPGGRDGDPRTPFAKGGFVPGAGNTDSVPAMLTPGEFVVRKDAAEKLGPRALSEINSGRTPAPAEPGVSVGTINITQKGDGEDTAREVVRQMRDLAFLGV